MDWSFIAQSLTAIFTAGLFFIAWRQLRKINKTSSAEFLHKLKTDLLNDKSSLLISLIDIGCLQFITHKNEEESYFNINLDSIKNKLIKKELKRKIDKVREGSYIIESFELDEFLLGHIEYLGILEEKKILDIDMIYEEFSWIIQTCFENHDIKKYIKQQREKDWDIYDKAESLAKKCNRFGGEKASTIKRINKL